MCFQIPRKQSKMSNLRSFNQAKCASGNVAPECCYRGLGTGNVSFGTSVGKHTFDPDISMVRDKDHPITVTFGIWRTVKDTTMSPDDVDAFAETLPMKRLGKPQEIGDFVKSIVEHDIKYLSGAVINFDGANSNFVF